MEAPEAADQQASCMDSAMDDQEPEQLDIDSNNISEEEPKIDHSDTIFFLAIRGLFDGMRAAISLEKLKSPADGDIAFVWDPEPPPALMDRHQPNLAGVKVKIQPYQSSMGQYGNSRAVSRASSRIASRFGGGSMMTSSTAFRKSVLAAVTMSKMSLSVSQSRPFDVPSWQSKAFSRNEADGSSGMQLSESAASSARYSLRTSSRTPADYAEVFRRQEVSQEIDRRESRIKQTQEIQRKSELKLKLRSLADPTISVEREEIMTSEAMQTEGRGRSRMASRGMTPALPLKKLSPLTKTSVQSSSPIAGPTETTITFRTEDYEGLDSHVVMLEKNGELLVGENCYVIAKKNRAELQHDLVHKSLVAPRFLLTSPHELAEEDPAKDHTNAPPSEHIRSPSRHAKGTRKTSVIQNPMFEGQSGSFQSFPKLDLDPSKTKLAKGVVLNRSATPNTRLYQAKNATAKTTAPVSVQKPASLAQIQEDATNQHLDESMSSLVQDAQRKHSNQSRKILEPVNAPSSATVQSSRYHKEIMGSFLPTHLQGDNDKHPQSLRIRTPAIQNRSSRKAPFWGPAEFDNEHDIDGGLFSLQSQHSLPEVSYIREFSSPPRGQIRMTGAASSTLLGTNLSSFPFSSSLPVVIKQSKR